MRVSPLIVAIALLASFLATAGAAPLAPSGPRLRLHRGTLDARTVDQAPALLARGIAPAPGPYAIIQFRGPIAPEDRAALEQTGVILLEYLPDFAYLVRGDAAQLDAAGRLPQVYARTPFTAADKLSPTLLRALMRGDAMMGQLRLIGWPDGGAALAQDLRAAVLNPNARMNAATLLQVAALPSVRWIEPVGRPRILNDVARTIMHADSAWQANNLYGAGQVIAVADSGLDTGIPATMSPDFSGRLVATHVLSPGGDIGDLNGHGTHVAGSVAGAGVQSGANPATRQYAGSFAGVAPEAGLVIQAFEVAEGGEVIGLPSDYYSLFAQAYADGARLHTDSWGDITGPITDTEAAYGGYPYGAQRTDQFIWDHPDMTIFFAAGNSGVDGIPGGLGFCTGGDGVVDPDSLLMPGTSKNVITVGASENQRSSGGLSGYPWLLLSFCFAAQPIATDLTSNNPNGMAAFSSRGPTDDGRAKPDIIAPGTNIVSNKSHYPGAGGLWGAYDSNYEYSGGTSMATPLAAGAGVLVRQWLTTRGISNPSAAAVKATLLNTTHDMAPGQYGTGATQEIPNVRPNSVAGWGRADLGFMNAAPPYALWVDDHTTGIATGQSVTYTNTSAQPLEVFNSAQPLRIMLAWSDPPASLSAAQQLVNDLDLKVIGPGGTTYYGNNIATGDRINNVEGIVIPNPPVGQYSIEVRGYNVPIASQPYALSVGGPLSNVAQLTLTKSANPSAQVVAGDLLTYTLSLSTNRTITQSIVLSDSLPLHTTFVSASNGGTLTGSVVTWSVPTLAAGTPVIRTLVVQVDPDVADNTQIVNSSYRAANGIDLPASGTPVSVLAKRPTASPPAQLALTKSATPSAEITPGALLTYTLMLSADRATSQTGVLTDILPLHTTFVSASNGGTLAGSVVTWSVPALAVGTPVTRTLVVRVDADAADGMSIINANYRASNGVDLPGSGVPVSVPVKRPTDVINKLLYLPLIGR